MSSKKPFKDTTVGQLLFGAASVINPTLGNILQGVTSPQEAIAEIQSSLSDGAVIRGADGQEISIQEALESMPEGGKVNPDGTLEPVPAEGE